MKILNYIFWIFITTNGNVATRDESYSEDRIYDREGKYYIPIHHRISDLPEYYFNSLNGRPRTDSSSLFSDYQRQPLYMPNRMYLAEYPIIDPNEKRIVYIPRENPNDYYSKESFDNNDVQIVHAIPKGEETVPFSDRYASSFDGSEEFNPRQPTIFVYESKPQMKSMYNVKSPLKLIKQVPYGRSNTRNKPFPGKSLSFYSKNNFKDNDAVTEESIYDETTTSSIRNPYSTLKGSDVIDKETSTTDKPTINFQYEKESFQPRMEEDEEDEAAENKLNENNLISILENYIEDTKKIIEHLTSLFHYKPQVTYSSSNSDGNLQQWISNLDRLFKSDDNFSGNVFKYSKSIKQDNGKSMNQIPQPQKAPVNTMECLNYINPKYSAAGNRRDMQMEFLRLWENENNPSDKPDSIFYTKSHQRTPNLWLDVSRVFYGNENLTITKPMLRKIFPIDQERHGNDFRYSVLDRSFKSGSGIAYRITNADFRNENFTNNNINSSNVHINEPDNRIVGGSIVDIANCPHQVAIYRNNEFFCGGAIIEARFVITAAHCFESKVPKEYHVKAGITHLEDDGQTRKAVKLFIHEEYNTCDNDIALILVDQPFEFNAKVAQIKLPDSNMCLKIDDVVTITGYGSTGGTAGAFNQDLFTIDLKLTSLEKCAQRKLKTVANTCITERQICTDSPAKSGTCYGDSGGPMVINGFIAGIVSWGSPCAIGDPDVFTNVSYFLKWIYNITGKN